MELTRNVLLLIHLAGMAGILLSLLRSRTKIATGLLHSALTALVAGLALVAIRYPLHSQDPMKWPLIDNAKIGIDRKSTRLNSSHVSESRMPSSA